MFQKLAEIADVSSLTKEERLYYDVALRKYRDTLCVLESAEQRGLKRGREEGLAEGREEGREEGRRENALSTAKNFLAEGISPETVARCVGISLEEVKALKEKLL